MPCSTDLYEVVISEEATSEHMNILFGQGDDGPKNEEVFNAVGAWDKKNKAFQYGRLCGYILKKRADMPDVGVAEYPLDAILGAKGFVKGVDALRNYLRAVGEFFFPFLCSHIIGIQYGKNSQIWKRLRISRNVFCE